MENEKIEECFFDETVDLIKLQFTDLFGQIKMVEMTRNQAEKIIKDGYAVNRFALGGLKMDAAGVFPVPDLLREEDGSTELYLKPDLSTCQLLPWDSGQENVGRIICNVCNPDGTPSWTDSRNILKEAVKRAEDMGFQIFIDFQCEFYLFHTDDEGRPTTMTHEVAGYYDAGPIDLAGSVRRDMMMSLAEAGLGAESAHHGLTPGQHSFLLPLQYGVEAGDCLLTFKSAVKRIAKRHGLHATFMPKPSRNGDGSGLHVGLMICDEDGKTSAKTTGFFRAGILKHVRDMMIFTNPLVNSYKRLAEERKAAFHPEFPANSKEAGSGREVCFTQKQDKSFRLQVLFPDPAANPYLALTALIAAGLDGIENSEVLSDCDKNPRFPETLGVVISELEENQFAADTFGEKFCKMYGEAKKEEWERFCSYVTDWEEKEYLYRW